MSSGSIGTASVESPRQFELGLGTARQRRDPNPEVYVEHVTRALDVGYRHVDTAQAYGNEEYVGIALDRTDVPREEVFVATKIHSDYLYYEDVFSTVEAQLDRLGLEYIDLLYVHWPLPPYDAEQTLAAFRELQDDGYVKRIGVSNFTPALLDEAREHAPIFAHQTELHPMCQQPELVEYAQRNDIWVVAHTPLAGGKVADVPVLSEIGEKHDATVYQVTLAWLLNKDNVAAVPLATGSHLEENLRALDLELEPEDLERIDNCDRELRVVDPDVAPWN